MRFSNYITLLLILFLFGGAAFGDSPLYFIENQGQVDQEAAYYIHGSDKSLYFTSGGVLFALTEGGGKRWTTKLEFLDANPGARPRGTCPQETVFSYFLGEPKDWKTGVPAFGRLVYSDLWPGIDLVYSGDVQRIKYAFIVKPGADPDKIRLAYHGVEKIALKDTGELVISTLHGSFEDGRPRAFQVINDKRVKVSMRYALADDARDDAARYGFELGEYDPALPLVMDPSMLIYCGFLGGSNDDRGQGIATDSSGNAYVTGYTDSADFPAKTGPDTSFNGSTDAFVAKVKPDGSGLVYCGFIGGSKNDRGLGVAVDSFGCAYVAGDTESDSDFPVLNGPDTSHNGGFDAFVAKVNSTGTGLVYCGFIGGQNNDGANGIGLDMNGCAYVTGSTMSDQTTFPVSVGPDLTFNGAANDMDAFVAKVSADGKSLGYCGYIGGSNWDGGNAIAVHALGGEAFVIGDTMSDQTTFPVMVGPDLTFNGGWIDAFVAMVLPDGSGLVYCGYIGGNGTDYGNGIAIDQGLDAYVTGMTASTQPSFPVCVGPDLTYNGGSFDAYVAKVVGFGVGLGYCGFIGGNFWDSGQGIAVDMGMNACVTGWSDSTTGFPLIAGPDLTYNGGFDGFAAKVNPAGAGLDYCGYLGGTGDDFGEGIAVDVKGHAYVTGYTDSPDFPVKTGPGTSPGGLKDAFAAKVILPLTANTNTLSQSTGGVVNFLLDADSINANRNYLMLGTMSGTVPGTLLPGGKETLPLNWDAFTNLVINMVNTPVFSNFMGVLDGQGQGTAKFDTLGPLPLGLVGATLHFAFALDKPWDFASNPAGILIVP